MKDESETPWIVAESDALLVELDGLPIDEDESDVLADENVEENIS